jgi:hypothetical protein
MSTISPTLKQQVKVWFGHLNTQTSARFSPQRLSLVTALGGIVPRVGDPLDVSIDKNIVKTYMASAVEIWHRAVHSFLVSASLTASSPIWSSVAGYYSSHYTIRGIAHLLGYFQLYKEKKVAQIKISNGQYVCTFIDRHANHREHKYYWKVVHEDPNFSGCHLFRYNDELQNVSDAGHRCLANYGDNINQFQAFNFPSTTDIVNRVEIISNMSFDDPPIPRRENYPDLDSVQIIAYHRLVYFRQILDEILSDTNRYWTSKRSPNWTSGLIDFQLAEQANLTLLN